MTKRRIIIIAYFSKPWNNGWFYKAGFEKNGCETVAVDPSSTPLEKIFDTVRAVEPYFILHAKDELPSGAFQELRKLSPVVQWYPDPLVPDWLPPFIDAADVFFTMSEGLVEDFRKLNRNAFFLSQAFEPSSFEVEGVTDADRRTYGSEATFVGNLGSRPQYLVRRKYLERVMREGLKLKWWGPRLPRKFSTIPLIMGKLGRAYGGRFVWGQEFAKAASLSKVFLAFDAMPHIRKSMSSRMYTAVGCGAFYMCQHVDGIEEVLEPNKEILTFRSEEEMVDMIRFYLKHAELRKKISEAGKKRVLNEHTYAVRTKQMLGMVENAL